MGLWIMKFKQYLTESDIEKIKKEMLKQAKDKHKGKKITFAGFEKNWDDCFTQEGNFLFLWYNIGKDTKAIKRKI